MEHHWVILPTAPEYSASKKQKFHWVFAARLKGKNLRDDSVLGKRHTKSKHGQRQARITSN